MMDAVYTGGLICLAVIVAFSIFVFANTKELTPAQSDEIRRIMEETDHEV
jgi:hypothetical protein